MNLRKHRPSGFRGKGDKAVLNLHKGMSRFLLRLKNQLNSELLNVSSEALSMLAAALVELAEDLYNNIGLWETIEAYNLEQFGTPLPIVLAKGKHIIDEPFDPFRIKYFLWILLPEIAAPKQLLTPFHPELDKLSLQIADFFDENFLKIPRGSGTNKFLHQPNKFSSQIKKKLLWLTSDSYLFRSHLVRHLAEENLKGLPATIDDYACMNCSTWSGLGAIDVLALTLDLTEEQRKDVRNWYKRQLAIFEVEELQGRKSKLFNRVDEQSYWVVENTNVYYKVGDMFMGNLYEYDNEWYWSITKAPIPPTLSSKVDEIIREAKMENPTYAYDDPKQKLEEQYNYWMTATNGRDLHLFESGQALKTLVMELSENSGGGAMKMLKNDEIYESKNEIALYISHENDPEVVMNCNDLIRAFEKGGNDLSEQEKNTLSDFISDEKISPNFVKKMVELHGTASIFQLYFGKTKVESYALEYLLRKYKGQYFRERFFPINLFD